MYNKSKSEFEHAPNADLDYGFIWTKWLEQGETITSSTWEASTGITLSKPQIDGNVTSVFAAGGEANKFYKLVNTIVTSEGRKDTRTLTLSCVAR